MKTRRIIDAHLHIFPERLLGMTLGYNTYETCGRCNFAGKLYYQVMPDIIGNSAFTVPTILRVMDNAGVARGVIMQGSSDAILPDTVEAVHEYPDRFWGAMRLDPQAHDLAERVRYYHNRGLTVIKCLTAVRDGFPSAYEENPLDSPWHREAWKLAESLRLTVAIDAGLPGKRGYCCTQLEKIIRNYPGLRFVICHMGLPGPGLEQEKNAYCQWQQMMSLGEYDNVWFECSALTSFFAEEAYPFPSAQKIVRDCMDTFDARKVIWATDMPGTLCDATYRQLIDTYERSTLFSEQEKALLFWDNAMAAYGKQ